jgi:hypothetical protein
MLSEAKIMFPEFETILKILQKKHMRSKVIKEKFNGEIARELSGLDGKELGAVIKAFRSFADDMWIYHSTHEQVRNEFIKFLEDRQ